jgi:flavin reductase (DIM6/NTAB) family NADH-FMN oxidoreductase RutF
VVLDKSTWTRQLLEAAGSFVLGVPARQQVDIVQTLGSTSGLALDEAGRDKFDTYGLATFAGELLDVPLLEGCVAWLECRLLPEPHNQERYDLFLGEVIAAQADARVFQRRPLAFRRA